MNQPLDATIDEHGNVRLLEPIQLPESYRALVVILPKPSLPGTPASAGFNSLREPLDAWEQRLRAAASPCGVSPPHSAFSSDELYD